MGRSKNQRVGKHRPQREVVCDKGHPKTWVHLAARGRKRMVAMCECAGFYPIRKGQE